jgi:environmental stress-induced protein Ves
MRVLRASDYREMPWKNGGGTTTEIAVSPVGAGLEDFDWRISMARVDGGGPFSLFSGIDRTLSILEGEGIVLSVGGRIPIELTVRSEPLPFPADEETHAVLIGGPVTDLNVMTRRGRVTHTVERIALSGPMETSIEQGTNLLFCAEGEVAIRGENEVQLGPRDTLLIGSEVTAIRMESKQPALAFLIRIFSGNHAV